MIRLGDGIGNGEEAAGELSIVERPCSLFKLWMHHLSLLSLLRELNATEARKRPCGAFFSHRLQANSNAYAPLLDRFLHHCVH